SLPRPSVANDRDSLARLKRKTNVAQNPVRLASLRRDSRPRLASGAKLRGLCGDGRPPEPALSEVEGSRPTRRVGRLLCRRFVPVRKPHMIKLNPPRTLRFFRNRRRRPFNLRIQQLEDALPGRHCRLQNVVLL